MKILLQGLFLAALSAPLFSALGEPLASDEIVAMEKSFIDASESLPPSCVRLESESGILSSGILARPNGYILTVAHGTEKDDSDFTVRFWDGTEGKAKIIRRDIRRDIAVLQLSGKLPQNVLPATTAEAPVTCSTAQPVIAVGFGGTGRATVHFGFGYRDSDSGQWITNCRLTAGDSGGGLFSIDGELIAIHSATTPKKHNRSFHIDISHFSSPAALELAQNSRQ